ncbi:MAG: efflux RND transporter periplasmic adaptor subunit [Candidatus Glassbacteria bacterium]|nr:efflux RND transporter periplasmic adaptor subunit [Candidatus Glassbacteria bacterium]
MKVAELKAVKHLLVYSAATVPLALSLSCGSPLGSTVPVYTVARGNFQNTLTVTGDLKAVNSQVISAPALSWSMGMPKIATLVDDGKKVEKGELLAQFDPSEVEKTLTDAQNELDIALAELAKTELNHSSEIEDLESDLQVAEIDLRISRLKLEQSSFEAEIDRKQIELNVENAEIQVEQARREIENKKKVQHEDRSKLKLKVNQARSKLEQARETLESLTVLAPSPGIAILRENRQTGEKVQVNDQVYPGWPLIGLPDLSLLKADAKVNEIDISRVEIGQRVRIRLDAYPDTVFTGNVKEIATLATRKDRGSSSVMVFETTIYLDGEDERLLPGMTVSCEILIDEIPDTLFIPLEALFFRDGERIVYVRNGAGFDERNIKIGTESENYAVVVEGLEEGESVALIDPTVSAEEEEDSGGNGEEEQ